VLIVLNELLAMAPGDKDVPKTLTESDENDLVIDVDALPSDAVTPSSKGFPPSSKGKRVANAVPRHDVIDVDDPETWACRAPSAGGPSSSAGPQEPSMKFDGALGVVLYDQKMDVKIQDAQAARAASADAVVPPDASISVDTRARAMVLGEAAMGASPSGEVASSPGDAASSYVGAAAYDAMPVPAASAPVEPIEARPGKVARLAATTSAPGALVLPTGKHGRRRSKWTARPVFVRKAAVMSVVSSAPRMMAYPSTPPASVGTFGHRALAGDTELGAGAADIDGQGGVDSDSSSVPHGRSGGLSADDDGADARPSSCIRDGDDVNGGSGSCGGGGGGKDGSGDSGVGGGGGGGGDGGGGHDGHGVGDGGTGGGHGGRESDTAQGRAAAAASDALANQLAARSRNPTLFPARFLAPGAPAVFASASAARAARPPVAPGIAYGLIPSGISPSTLPVRATTPHQTRASPAHSLVPVGSDEDDGSSEEMDDDALVMAYVTPPASPAPQATPSSSPLCARAPSRKRRRESHSRVAREASIHVAAGAAGDAGTEEPGMAIKDLYDALRSGLSSLRREFTRFRAELVIVKSQAASSLRRMDGIAAAAEGRETRAGVVLERLGELIKVVQDLDSHVTKTTADGTGRRDGDGNDCVALVTEIKVRCDSADPLVLTRRVSGM